MESYPLYLPIWKFTARASGWFMDKEGKTLPCNIVRTVSAPAYDATYIGVPTDMPGTSASLSPETSFPAMQVKLKPSALDTVASEKLKEEVETATAKAKGRHISIKAEPPVLCLYPAWIFRFRTKNGEHTLALDGITGKQFNSLDIRLDDGSKEAEMVLAVACGLTAGAAVGLASLQGWHGLEIGLVATASSLFVVTNLLHFLLKLERPRRHVRPGRAGA
ncbi:MAG: hypothetical protein QXP70_05455, partial [Methanomassiliicoccales archaeon]